MQERILRKQASRSRKESKLLQSANGQYETVEANLVDINWVGGLGKEIIARIPKGSRAPRYLIYFGKSTQKAVCFDTGRVYQQTTGWYEPLNRFVDVDRLHAQYDKAFEELLDSIGAW